MHCLSRAKSGGIPHGCDAHAPQNTLKFCIRLLPTSPPLCVTCPPRGVTHGAAGPGTPGPRIEAPACP